MPKTPDYPVPALEKGLDIIEALAVAAIPQSLAELAVNLKRSRGELFRMLNCLERRGYVTRDALSSKYGLSLKLFTLAHGHTAVEKLLQAARLPMRTFTEKFWESCHLSVLDRGKLLVVAQEESPERVRLSIEVGAVFDPARTASGRLLLAYLGEAERAAVGERARAQEYGDFDKALAAIRKAGVSTAESETVNGVRDLAVLVGSPGSEPRAALAVTRLMRRDERRDDAALIAGLQVAAREIGRELGIC